jgi:hypothetical protein
LYDERGTYKGLGGGTVLSRSAIRNRWKQQRAAQIKTLHLCRKHKTAHALLKMLHLFQKHITACLAQELATLPRAMKKQSARADHPLSHGE